MANLLAKHCRGMKRPQQRKWKNQERVGEAERRMERSGFVCLFVCLPKPKALFLKKGMPF